jgi:hypothetical protein
MGPRASARAPSGGRRVGWSDRVGVGLRAPAWLSAPRFPCREFSFSLFAVRLARCVFCLFLTSSCLFLLALLQCECIVRDHIHFVNTLPKNNREIFPKKSRV